MYTAVRNSQPNTGYRHRQFTAIYEKRKLKNTREWTRYGNAMYHETKLTHQSFVLHNKGVCF